MYLVLVEISLMKLRVKPHRWYDFNKIFASTEMLRHIKSGTTADKFIQTEQNKNQNYMLNQTKATRKGQSGKEMENGASGHQN